ncbi:hypothetical protein FB567DRAFT_473985 [Paraphoma chrysanthemicola]|uniref:methylated diphthine methylhydrolase n=1 Tax=Paraphoma chrysanthemicola TaxID=798071 RepID=A0A8K0VWM6_9PLEO|nr:hypothetical protein FB567DRAFT_473985 [Paraphoma chrysanthemicola]
MTSISSLRAIVLDLPPSCIEFYPLAPQYAVIGTYNLEKQEGQQEREGQEVAQAEGQKTSQQRNGSLILAEVIGDDVVLRQTLPTPSAILDVHFNGKSEAGIFGVATSTGSIGIYKLAIAAKESPAIVHMHTLQFFPEDALITAFSWHPDGKILGMTLSTGEVDLGEYAESKTDAASARTFKITAHDLEAWTLAFIPDGSGVLSGGDDAALRFAELPRRPLDDLEDSDVAPEHAPWRKMPWADKKVHGAGVTAILPVYWDEDSVLTITGSYDDNIRLVEAPTVGRRQVLAEMNLSGGVWRLKVLSRKPVLDDDADQASWGCGSRPEEFLLLVSCMHAGTRIMKLACVDEVWQFEVLAKFEEHKSMNYGSDNQPKLNAQGQRTFLSTSFYDRLLCLWRY